MPMTIESRAVTVEAGKTHLLGDLTMPPGATGLVLFAHGSGSSRHSPRNRTVAQMLNHAGLATLLFDLLTAEEEVIDIITRRLRFDIELLAKRLIGATDWVAAQPVYKELPIGYFGSSTGAAAALIAATKHPQVVHAVVSRGGRPDLAMAALPQLHAPTLLIVGSEDQPVIALNEEALTKMTGVATLEIVPGATHLFEEEGTLEQVAQLAAAWFVRYLK